MPSQRKRAGAPDATEHLRLAFQALMGRLMRHLRQAALAEGLTFSQMFVLRRIQRAGSIPATTWAPEVGVTASSLSSVVDGLVEAGLVRRARETQDRRVVRVSLTPQGTRLMRKLETEQQVLWKEMTQGMEASELHAAADLLERSLLSPSLQKEALAARTGGRARPRGGT